MAIIIPRTEIWKKICADKDEERQSAELLLSAKQKRADSGRIGFLDPKVKTFS